MPSKYSTLGKAVKARLKEFVLAVIDPAAFYRALFPEWDGKDSSKVFCPHHTDTRPSLSIRVKDGAFRCHACTTDFMGSHVIDYFMRVNGISYEEALRDLYKAIVPVVPRNYLEQAEKKLWGEAGTNALMFLQSTKRGLSEETIRKFRLGFDGQRITIPIPDDFGFVVNVRRYDFTGTQDAKIISYAKGFGKARIFPVRNLIAKSKSDEGIILCEGEWDAIILNQEGFTAVTNTGGAGTWPSEYTRYFYNKPVFICYDNDKPQKLANGQVVIRGKAGALKVAAVLRRVTDKVKIMELPEGIKDPSEFFAKHQKTADDFRRLMAAAPIFQDKAGESRTIPADVEADPIAIAVADVTLPENIGKKTVLSALVVAKDYSSHSVPAEFRMSCNRDKGAACYYCPLGQGPKVFTLSPEDPALLALLDTTSREVESILRERMKIAIQTCRTPVEVLKAFTVEYVEVIPNIRSELENNKGYSTARVYYIGHGIRGNNSYQLVGRPQPHPGTQRIVFHSVKAETERDALDTFRIGPKVHLALCQAFQPRGITVQQKLDDIYRNYERESHILLRPDLHQAIDLPFFSALHFHFNGEYVNKGWLEFLGVGDTRTGKSQVLKALFTYYGMGSIVDAETLSFAGLIGGVEESNRRRFVKWGKLPQNDRGIVGIEEASGLPPEVLERMSQVRSEGIASVTKIQSEEVFARTRAIWLSNPRDGKKMKEYNHGVEAIQKLIGKPEDIARFDYAMVIAGSEVPKEIINAKHRAILRNTYPRNLSRILVRFAWSRKAQHIKFTNLATDAILAAVPMLGRKYSDGIPLVQMEDIRKKIARIAVAIACRVYSSPDGESVIVTQSHARAAVNFLQAIYDKPSMAYNEYSRVERRNNTLRSPEEVRKKIEGMPSIKRTVFVEGMLSAFEFTKSNIQNLLDGDHFLAADMLSFLVAHNCVKQMKDGYTKTQPFTVLLRAVKATAT